MEKNSIDISNWDLNRFRPALDFYLNSSFNIDNVLTFSKFYTYFH